MELIPGDKEAEKRLEGKIRGILSKVIDVKEEEIEVEGKFKDYGVEVLHQNQGRYQDWDRLYQHHAPPTIARQNYR